jgi:hypothetical protein
MSSERFAATRLIVILAAIGICFCAFLPALAAGEDVEPGPLPALAPGQAPPLPKAGPLADPRSQDQVGFPVDLTRSVIPPGSPLTPAVVALGEKLFFDSPIDFLRNFYRRAYGMEREAAVKLMRALIDPGPCAYSVLGRLANDHAACAFPSMTLFLVAIVVLAAGLLGTLSLLFRDAHRGTKGLKRSLLSNWK